MISYFYDSLLALSFLFTLRWILIDPIVKKLEAIAEALEAKP